MKRTVIVGFGNLLMTDDGVGIHVINKLEQEKLPPGVELIDGGVASLEVLDSVRDANKVIIIDALRAGQEPGTVYRLTPEDLGEAQSAPSFSLHQFTLVEALHLAAAIGPLPPIIIYGVEPGQMELGLELTMPVAAAAERAAGLIKAEVWGDDGA